MPLPGGEADKLGNRYEGRWTVYCMIDVMDEKADYIELEKPGEDGFEFFLQRNGQLECHQVKRQISSRGQWTVSSLENNQNHVLSDFWRTLQRPDAICVFVSTQGSELKELTERVKDSQSWKDFETNYLNKSFRKIFNELCVKWENCSQDVGYNLLKRISIKNTGDEDQLIERIDTRLTVLVEGDPQVISLIRLELGELARNKLHHQLMPYDIWHYLEQRGYRRKEWRKDPNVFAAIEKNNELYFSRFDHEKIAGEFIERNEANIAIDKLTSLTNKKGLLLTGEAGLGKSGVLGQVLTTLKTQGIPLIVFRIDRLEPTQLPDQLGEQLGLPGSPANVLAAVAQGRECVLIIDQIDTVSQPSGRNPRFFECVEQIIKQAQVHGNIRLLLACRKFDLENDDRFRNLVKSDGILENLEIRRLSHIQVKEVCSRLELDETKLTPVQLDLLSIPLHLKLLEDVVGDLEGETFNLFTVQELYDAFWKRKQEQIKDCLGQSCQWTKVIDALCQYMSNNQTIYAPQSIVDDWVDDANVMASNHVLVKENKRFSFFHESFFDYAFARRFSANDQKLSSHAKLITHEAMCYNSIIRK